MYITNTEFMLKNKHRSDPQSSATQFCKGPTQICYFAIEVIVRTSRLSSRTTNEKSDFENSLSNTKKNQVKNTTLLSYEEEK